MKSFISGLFNTIKGIAILALAVFIGVCYYDGAKIYIPEEYWKLNGVCAFIVAICFAIGLEKGIKFFTSEAKKK